MNKRSRKTKGLSRRLIAWLLCCVCLLGAAPISAIALEASATPVVEETATIEPTEEVTVVLEATAAPTPTALSDSEDTSVDVSGSEAETTAEPADTVTPENTVTEEPTSTIAPASEDTSNDASNSETENTSESETVIQPEITSEPESTVDPETTPETGTETTVEPETTVEATTAPAPEAEPEETAVPQSFYDKVMAAQSCEEMFNLFQAEENAEAVMALTVNELTSAQIRVNEMGDDGWKDDLLEVLDMLIAIASGEGDGKETDLMTTMKVTNTISNAEVAYVNFTSGSSSNVTFVPVSSGQQVSLSSTTGVLIFFLKPADGYLLTEYKTSDGSSRDLYGISIAASASNIQYFKNNSTAAQEILDQAKARGYVGYYAFSYASGSTTYTSAYIVEGQKPQMTVTAVANPNENLKPGDKVTFTVTITPGHTNVADKVTDTRITSLKINGTPYTATKNADGTYSVDYTITTDDWNNKKAHLDVDAELDYEYAIGVTDTESVSSEILTKTTITSSASTDCTFATKQGVVYAVTFDPADKADITKFPTTPVDSNTYFEGSTVTVDKDYNRTPVDDPVNKGTWTFDGWYHGEEKVGETLTMGTSSILLTGKWTFTPYPNADLTIKKTVSGNMQDSNKEFTFTITADKAMTYDGQEDTTFTFNLKKNEEKVISVPVGATVTVSEDADGYTYSIGSGTTITGYTDLKSGNGISFTMPNDASKVVFNNAKDITVDTGVILDTLPYVLILAVVVIGVVVLIKRRRNRDDD